MSKQSYSDKLLDPRWQKKRLEILERDSFTCRNCGAKDKTLHVHHFIYEKNPWDSENRYLMTLCEECHARVSEMWVLLLKSIVKSLDVDYLYDKCIHEKVMLLSMSIDDIASFFRADGICKNDADRIIKWVTNSIYRHAKHSCERCDDDQDIK